MSDRAPLLGCVHLDVFGGARLLVRDLSWQVRAGERWAVLGPNGAGKSTLLATMAGVRAPRRGEVQIQARSMQEWSIEQMAAARALVTDRWHDPFSASVLQTVLTARFRFNGDGTDPSGTADAMARHWLAQFDCAELIDHDIGSLSRGERQRVALATALVQDTPLVLLDEPIAHQDPRHQLLVLDRLASEHARTLVASLHDMNAAARFATHALLLSGRGEWSSGPAAEMLTAPRLSDLFQTEVIALQRPGAAPIFAINVARS
jgi:iron complex transport system ATP-binding protein